LLIADFSGSYFSFKIAISLGGQTHFAATFGELWGLLGKSLDDDVL